VIKALALVAALAAPTIGGPAVPALPLARSPTRASPAVPFSEDALGPIRDVTAHWRDYQPASEFCIWPDAQQYTPGGDGAGATGRDLACRRSGFTRHARGLVKIVVRTPPLCRGCRRLFIDFSRIPTQDSPPHYYAHGHAFYRLASANFSYTVEPVAHSPNTKNFTNDKLLAPNGSPQEPVLSTLDRHQTFGYVTDTVHFIHTAIQGPYYIGPWYLNRQGRRIYGVYLDVNLAQATPYGNPQLDAIGYGAGFDARRLCPSDGDAFYAGCFDWWALSTSSVDPFEDSP
jgi:hypothetical protein